MNETVVTRIRRAVGHLPGEEQDDPGVGDEDAPELPGGEPVARDHEMREDDRVHGVEIDQDRRVRRAGEPGPHVGRGHLHAEEHAQDEEGPPLLALYAEPDEAARGPRPEADDRPPHDEAHPRQAEGRGVLKTELDHDTVGAPEDRDEQGSGRAREVDVLRGMAQKALAGTTPGIIPS